MNIKKRFKKESSLKHLSTIILIVCIIMIVAYFSQFNRGFSPNPEDWGIFGSYFASIAGMLAFLGLIYTIKQSNDKADKAEYQFKISEERGIFFKMLELYQRQADSFSDGKVKGQDAFRNFNKMLTNDLILGYICKDIVNTKNYINGKSKDELFVINSIIDTQFNGKDIVPFKFSTKSETIQIFLSDRYNAFMLEQPIDFDTNHKIYEFYVQDSFRYKSITDAYEYMRYAAESIYYKNSNYLGQYFRNIYYIMEMISKTIESDYYSKIFRAQLSSTELSLIIYNSLSSNSSRNAVQLLLDFDMFNNIDIKDIFLGRFHPEFMDDMDILFNPEEQEVYSKGTSLGASYKTKYDTFINSILKEYLKDPINIK